MAVKFDKMNAETMIEWGHAEHVRPGEIESGDLHVVKTFETGALVGVVDGLGHGHEAAVAASAAVSVLEEYPGQQPIYLVKQCHEAVKGTRGVVLSCASLNFVDHTMSWIGVGNVEGILLRSEKSA